MGIAESTAIYVSVFLITCISTNLAEKKFKKGKNVLAVFFSAIAILIPSLVAGVRANTVGKDVLEYAVRTFDYAKSSGTFAHMQSVCHEPTGYQLLAYLLSKVFNDAGYLLFFSQLLVVCPVYIVAYKYRKYYPMWLTMCSYMLLFFNDSLNVMKQSVAAAFILLCYCFIKEKKYIKSGVSFVVAYFFHSSAIIGLMFLLLSKLIQTRKHKITIISIAAAFVIFITNLKRISNFLLDYSLIPERYIRNVAAVFDMTTNVYLRIQGFNYHVFFGWVFRVLFVAVPLYYLHKTERDKQIDPNVRILTVIGVVFFTYVLFSFRTIYGGRISLYCDYFLILLVPSLKKVFKKRKYLQRLTANSFVIAFMGVYWFVWIMVYGQTGSNHFSFRF